MPCKISVCVMRFQSGSVAFEAAGKRSERHVNSFRHTCGQTLISVTELKSEYYQERLTEESREYGWELRKWNYCKPWTRTYARPSSETWWCNNDQRSVENVRHCWWYPSRLPAKWMKMWLHYPLNLTHGVMALQVVWCPREIYKQITNSHLKNGHNIGTRTIELDGTVGRISGIDKRKLVAAIEAGAFLPRMMKLRMKCVLIIRY